jgi:hypothetical protein
MECNREGWWYVIRWYLCLEGTRTGDIHRKMTVWYVEDCRSDMDVHKTLKPPSQRGSRFEVRLCRGFPHRPDVPLCPPSLLFSGYRDLTGIKTARAWSWNPSLSSPDVKKHWRYISTPDLCLHGMLQVEYHVVQRLRVALPIWRTWVGFHSDRVESHKVIITGWG